MKKSYRAVHVQIFVGIRTLFKIGETITINLTPLKKKVKAD